MSQKANPHAEETKYDQLFKDTLKTFFDELLQLVAPNIAAQLDVSKVEFIDKEHFTDMPKGKQRYMDIVAKVPTKQPKPGETEAQLVLVHTEIEGNFGEAMDKRMSRYFFQLQHRHDLPVLPLVIFVNGGEPNITTRSHQDTVLGMDVCRFSYLSLGLSPSSAQDFLKKPGALAAALAVHMKQGSLSKAQLAAECMTKIAQAKLNDAKQLAAMNFVKTYLVLDHADKEEYTQLIEGTPLKEVKMMELTWADQIRVEGELKGKAQAKAEWLLESLALRKIKVEKAQKDTVLACTDIAQLDAWFKKAMTAKTAAEVFGTPAKAKHAKKK
jgi:hypothetical protein